jgi:VanZ family protein
MRNLLFTSAILVFILITVLSLMPPKSELQIPTNDKVGHFLAYSVFSLNICLLFPQVSKKMVLLLLAVIGYGILLEFLQGFVGRSTSFYDFLANTTGVSIGFGLYLFLAWRRWRFSPQIMKRRTKL